MFQQVLPPAPLPCSQARFRGRARKPLVETCNKDLCRATFVNCMLLGLVTDSNGDRFLSANNHALCDTRRFICFVFRPQSNLRPSPSPHSPEDCPERALWLVTPGLGCSELWSRKDSWVASGLRPDSCSGGTAGLALLLGARSFLHPDVVRNRRGGGRESSLRPPVFKISLGIAESCGFQGQSGRAGVSVLQVSPQMCGSWLRAWCAVSTPKT